jgi:phosphatidylglycerophosphate synthase
MTERPFRESPAQESPSTYRYDCDDRSVLYPLLKRHLFTPLMRFVPAGASPNTLTGLGNAAVWLSFVACLAIRASRSRWFLVPALFNFLYLCCDNMDGIQARRTGRSSPLGEFLDHWSDALNIGLVIFGYVLSTEVPPRLVMVGLAVAGLAYFSAYWEQAITGKLHFGHFGSLEGVLALCSFDALIAIVGCERFAGTPVVWGLSISNLLLLVGALGLASTFLASMWRVRRRLHDFLPQTVLYAAVVAWREVCEIPLLLAGSILSLLVLYLAGRAVIARVLAGPYRGFDPLLFLVLGGAMAAAILGGADRVGCGLFVVAYLLIRVTMDFTWTVAMLRHHLDEREILARALRP